MHSIKMPIIAGLIIQQKFYDEYEMPIYSRVGSLECFGQSSCHDTEGRELRLLIALKVVAIFGTII
jgi:hypothetical protein